MTINAQTLAGNWNEIKGKLRERWGQVTQDDLQKVNGNVEQLVGLIERKTGEARQQVEKYLSELTADGSSGVGKVLNAAKDYAGQAVDSVEGAMSGMGKTMDVAKDYAGQAADSVEGALASAAEMARGGYEQTGRMVRQRPFESLAVGFGAGLITGVVVGLVLKSK